MVTKLLIKGVLAGVLTVSLGVLVSFANELNPTQYAIAKYDEGDYRVKELVQGKSAETLKTFFKSAEWVQMDLDIEGLPEYLVTDVHTTTTRLNEKASTYKVYFLENSGELICVSKDGYTRITVYEHKDIYDKIVNTASIKVQ